MNEIRDLIIGIDIGKEYNADLLLRTERQEEARSLSMKVGTVSMRHRDASVTVQNMMIIVWDWKRNILPGKKAASWLEIFMISAAGRRNLR